MAEREVSDSPVLRHLLPHQGHLQGPMGAGLGVQRPVVLTLHLGGDGGGSGYRRLRREHPLGWLWLSASGTRPGPGTKWRAAPARRPPHSSGLPEQLRPVRGPAGALGEAGGVQSCWEPCLGQDHRLEPGARGSPHPAGLHAVGQHDQGVALLLPHQAPEVAHGLRQGALGRDELLGAPETLVEGGRRVRAPLPPALTFRGSEPSLTPALRG